jgi:hypothetical protein
VVVELKVLQPSMVVKDNDMAMFDPSQFDISLPINSSRVKNDIIQEVSAFDEGQIVEENSEVPSVPDKVIVNLTETEGDNPLNQNKSDSQ